jgi:hypothetical protein
MQDLPRQQRKVKAMTERPIPFQGEMVRAILCGRKTQTRRIMKVQPWPDATVEVGLYHPHRIDRHGESQPGPAVFGAIWDHQDIVNGGDAGLRCPYGAPGDMLWMREAWRAWSQYDDWPPSRLPPGVDVQYIADASAPWSSRYRSPRYMPRWASRITLRITDIRVERLQDISEDDAKAEGVGYKNPGYLPGTKGNWIGSFAYLWNEIYGPGAWEANPWVWVVSFERVKP